MKAAKLAVAAALTMCIGTALAAPPAARTSGYVAKTERGQLAQQIVRNWSGYVNKIYGTTPMQWSNSMAGTFSAADMTNLRTASKRQTYEAMMGTLVGQNVTDSKIITAMAKSNGSLDSVKALGSSAADLVYTMITPCRIADTRVAGGILSGNVARSFNSDGANFTAQGGSSTNCGIPANTSAVVMNVTVVNPTNGPGNIKLFPYGASAPTTASVNFAKSQIVGNELIVKQTLGQPFDFTAISNFNTHVVIDVAGYFMAPEATALDCQVVIGDVSAVAPDDGSFIVVSAATCPAGTTRTSLECYQTGSAISSTGIWTSTSCGFRDAKPGDGSTSTGRAYSRCCRVPGR